MKLTIEITNESTELEIRALIELLSCRVRGIEPLVPSVDITDPAPESMDSLRDALKDAIDSADAEEEAEKAEAEAAAKAAKIEKARLAKEKREAKKAAKEAADAEKAAAAEKAEAVAAEKPTAAEGESLRDLILKAARLTTPATAMNLVKNIGGVEKVGDLAKEQAPAVRDALAELIALNS